MNGLLGNAAYYMQRQQPGGLLPAGPASFQGGGGGRTLSAPSGVQVLPSKYAGLGEGLAALGAGIGVAADAYKANQEAEKQKAQWQSLFTPTQMEGGPTVANAATAPISKMLPNLNPQQIDFLQKVGPETGMPWIQSQVLKTAEPKDPAEWDQIAASMGLQQGTPAYQQFMQNVAESKYPGAKAADQFTEPYQSGPFWVQTNKATNETKTLGRIDPATGTVVNVNPPGQPGTADIVQTENLPALAVETGLPVFTGRSPYQGMSRDTVENLRSKQITELQTRRTAILPQIAKSDDRVALARQAMPIIEKIASTPGMPNTGGPVANNAFGRWVLSTLTPEYNALVQINAALTPAMREPGSGATSDFDARMFRISTIGPDNFPEVNRAIAQGMIEANSNLNERFLFEQSYVENYGTTSGMDAAWRRYLNDNPIFDKASSDKPVLNEDRTHWADYFRKEATLFQQFGGGSDGRNPDRIRDAATNDVVYQQLVNILGGLTDAQLNALPYSWKTAIDSVMTARSGKK